MTTGFFFNQSGTGHINPTLGLVTELARRGETIVYYAQEAHGARITAAGAQFRCLEPRIPIPQISGGVHLAAFKLEEAMAVLPELLDVVRREQPDYIIFDAMCPLGWLLAQVEHIPAITSCTTFAFTPAVVEAMFGPNHPELLDTPADRAHLPHLQDVIGSVRAQYGLEIPKTWRSTLSLFGDITLLYTSASMHPAPEALNGSFRFVGPCLRPENMPDFPYDVLDSPDLIYISLGTEFNDNPNFYQDCITAFAKSPYQVLLSVGERIDLERFDPLPENIRVCRSVPQLDVLRHARLFVSHGGANSVHEALFYDVPLVVVPQMIEQAINGQQVAAKGAGLWLDGGALTPSTLRRAVDTVLADPAFKQHAEHIGATLRSTGGATRAADEVLARHAMHEGRALA